MGHCVKFNPDDDKQHLFVVGSADKKIVTWDTRSNEIVQEYDRHMGAVNTITFCDDNRRYALLYKINTMFNLNQGVFQASRNIYA